MLAILRVNEHHTRRLPSSATAMPSAPHRLPSGVSEPSPTSICDACLIATTPSLARPATYRTSRVPSHASARGSMTLVVATVWRPLPYHASFGSIGGVLLPP